MLKSNFLSPGFCARRTSAWLAVALWIGVPAPSHAQKVPVIEKSLPNGMTLLMVERHDDPTIAGGWVAHVGSANERPGITGIAHLFEHMMFKGTPTVGTKDYKKDIQIIAAQEKLRDEMRKEEAKMRAAWRKGELVEPDPQTRTNVVFSEPPGRPVARVQTLSSDATAALQAPENKTARYKELEEQFKGLIAQQREIIVKNEWDRIYTTGGASGMNAFTSTDLTGYFITVPKNKLELWMWMESERLYRPVFREFYAERDVVFEERRMRTESTPLGKFAEAYESMVWTAHPYHWPIVGWPSDIPAISKAQADEFYALYYSPQNITLILVGDFKADDAYAYALKYFTRIPRGKIDPPDVVTMEVEQLAEKRMYAEAEANPQVDVAWHTVPFGHRDVYPLNILAQILSTRTGRLYKGLVLGKQVATEVQAGPDTRKWHGMFYASGEAKEGHTPEEVEQAIYAELERMKNEDVPENELQKVKNNFAAYEFRKLTSNMSILMQLIQSDGLGDWREINTSGAKYQAVTAEDVRRVVNKYFTKENRNVAIYTRKAEKPGADAATTPDLSGLSDEQKSAVKAMMSRLKQEKDAAKLKTALGRMEDAEGKADGAMKAFIQVQKKLVQQRIAELK